MIKKGKLFLSLPLAVVLSLLSGCGITVSNMTPKQVPQNPSGIYSFKMTPKLYDAEIIKNSVRVSMVIDGKEVAMSRERGSRDVYSLEYQIRANQNEALYYYITRYQINIHGAPKDREIKSELYELKLINRYVISMESYRGPVGARIPVVGRGFSECDKIEIGGQEADTLIASSNSIFFIVPALNAGKSYPVYLVTGAGRQKVGSFYVDASKIELSQKSIDLAKNERLVLVFQINHDAPQNGLHIDVSTDIPNSIIMEDVIIPGGSRTVSATIQGGEAGKGNLYIVAPGFNETVVPVRVSDHSSTDSAFALN